MVRAVVFDLWQTLAAWPEARSRELRAWWAGSLGIPAERIDELWYGADFYRVRETGPIRAALVALYESLGVEGDVEEVARRRLELHREALVPLPDALSTIASLRERGYALGLVSNCTEEVALVWEETPFAGLFDATVFSATVGCAKPDAQIYEAVAAQLGVAAADCLFVGDGANDELAGAERVGMTAVLLHADGGVPHWEALRGWGGLRVDRLSDVLRLVP